MENIITDPEKIDEILERGVENIFPSKEALREKLMSGQRIRLYCGFDPSASALHIGNAAMLSKLAQFQELGHEVVFLVGDFTGMIGDPTDKATTRKKMTREEVLENAKDYKKQASGYLKFDGDNPAEIKFNSEWLDKLNFKGIIDIASNFTVQQMVQRDMFKKRMADQNLPIYLHEFLYPLAQGYDSVAMDVDLEIGGNDQMFNMLVGRDLQKIINNKEKFVMTLKLLADETGNKMGKTEGNAVFLNQSPEEMYIAVMSWTDGLIGIGFEMVTSIPLEEIKKIKAALEDSEQDPRVFKMVLAHEIVKINYGEDTAKKAQEYYVKTRQEKEIPDDAEPSPAPSEGILLTELMVRDGLAVSKGDARRKIEQGGVTMDGERIEDYNYELGESDNGKVIKVGKFNFRKIVIE